MNATMNGTGGGTIPKPSRGSTEEYPIPEEGEHRMVISQLLDLGLDCYEGVCKKDANGEDRYRATLEFRILGGDDAGMTLMGWFGWSTFAGNGKAAPSHLYTLCSAIAARMAEVPPLDDDGFDINDWIDKPFVGYVAHKVKGDKTYANLKSWRSAKEKTRKPVPVVAPIEVDEDDEDANPFADEEG